MISGRGNSLMAALVIGGIVLGGIGVVTWWYKVDEERNQGPVVGPNDGIEDLIDDHYDRGENLGKMTKDPVQGATMICIGHLNGALGHAGCPPGVDAALSLVMGDPCGAAIPASQQLLEAVQ